MKLYCIGIGPGGEEQMTLRAVRALEKCDCVAGYGLYLDLIENLISGKERIESGMTREVLRCKAAVEAAKQGKTVAVVSSGDACPTCSRRGTRSSSVCAAQRLAISASRCTIRRAKSAPTICAVPAIFCWRLYRRKPSAVWCAALAEKAKAARLQRSVSCVIHRSIC